MFKKILYLIFAVIVILSAAYITYISTFYNSYSDKIRECVATEKFENILKIDFYHLPDPVFEDETENCKIKVFKIAYVDHEGKQEVGYFFIAYNFSEAMTGSIATDVSDETALHKTSITLHSNDLQYVYPHYADITGSDTASNIAETWVNSFNMLPLMLLETTANTFFKIPPVEVPEETDTTTDVTTTAATTEAPAVEVPTQTIDIINSFEISNANGDIIYSSGDLGSTLNLLSFEPTEVIDNGIAPHEDYQAYILGNNLIITESIVITISLIVMGGFGFLFFRRKPRIM